MDPILNKEHKAFREKIRDFAEKEIRPVASELDQNGQFSTDLTLKMGKLGLLGINIPGEYGGAGLDTLSYIIAVEELARIDGSQAATVAAHNSLGLAPIYHYGTEKQRRDYLPRLSKGDQLWAFGLTEPLAGSDSRNTLTTAVLQDKNWVINGEKLFITNSASEFAAGATIQAVTAEKDGSKELSVILIDRNTAGYSAEPIHSKMMWRAADTGKLFFDNVVVPEENLLGERGQGDKIMLATLDGGRLSIAAMGLGLAVGAFELAMDYAGRREQFGRPIAKFQAIQFKLADMAMKIELARNLLYKACWLKDNKQPFAMEAAMAKQEVADESLQIHGAHGLMKYNDIERFYRDQRILQIGEGTSEILRVVIARYLGLR